MARGQSRQIKRTLGRLLQERIPASRASPGLSRSMKRFASAGSTVFARRIDDRELQDSLLAAEADEHLERRQHSQRRTANQREANAAGRFESVRSAQRISLRHLCVRTAPAELVEPYASTSSDETKPRGNSFKLNRRTIARLMTWWIVSAKQEETRLKRLEKLIEDSAKGKRIIMTHAQSHPRSG